VHAAQPDTRIYGVSANALQSDFDELLAAGALQCYTKPLDRELLRDIVRMELKLKKHV
jgi:CheY-like chemotaxis protein